MMGALRRVVVVFVAVVLSVIGTAPGSARAAVEGREVEYSSAGVTLKGYVAWDAAVTGRRPGVLVVHEWWGHTEYARRRARMLAELGYVGFALDMYGDGKTAAHPEDAGKFSAEIMKNADVTKGRFLAALDRLKAQPQVDPSRVAAIGYCMGGAVVLNMARSGLDLRGVASFHGMLGTASATPGGFKAKVLVMNGAADTFITAEQIAALKKEMADAGADFRFIDYPGSKHGFTNPEADEYAKKFGMPVAYNAEADRLSWEELKKFLADVFK